MKVYENIVVGNFLFALGLRLGRSNPELVGVNLLQQSPWDKPLADVLLTSASICRVIEFKRSTNKDDKETRKHQLLVDALNNPDSDPTYLSLSREIHWYVEIDDVEDQEISFETRAIPYYDLDQTELYIDLMEFVERTARQAAGDTLPKERLSVYKRYLDRLIKINGYVGNGEQATGAAPGALILTASKNGQFRWLATNDLSDMFLTRQGYELKLEMQYRLQREGYDSGREIPGYEISL